AENWNQFVRSRAQLRSYIKTLIANRDDAADLLQDTWLIALSHADAPVNTSDYAAWCRGIARNLAHRHWRTAKRDAEVFTPADLDENESDEMSDDICIEDVIAARDTLMESLEALDEPSRALLTSRYVDGKTSSEIAKETKQSAAAIRMKIM